MNILQSMKLASQNILMSLNPDENYLPHFCLEIAEDYTAALRYHWTGHNIGRVWDCLLRMEEATGEKIPADIEGKMLVNIKRYFENSDHACLEPIDANGVAVNFEIHSLREGLLTLNGLIKLRHDGWALDKSLKMVDKFDSILNDDGTFNTKRCDYHNLLPAEKQGVYFDSVTTSGRFIEALVYHYELTKNPASFRMAQKLTLFYVHNILHPDGTLNRSLKSTHMHSYMGTIRGMLQFARLTQDRLLIEKLAKTYEVAIRSYLVDESGLCCHGIDEDRQGDPASAADSAQIAFWLACEGYTEYFDDVERIVRARLIPSQITASPKLSPVETPDCADSVFNLDARVIGGYGGMLKYPHAGKNNYTDITASVLHSLAYFYAHSLRMERRKPAEVTVLLHFDNENDCVKVENRRGQRAEMAIFFKKDAVCSVRVPGFARPSGLSLLGENGEKTPLREEDGFVSVNGLAGQTLTLVYDLPKRETSQTSGGVSYTFRWKGDEITGVHPNHDFYPLYDSIT